MFLALRQRKTTVFTRFWASASKNHGIYSVLWPGPSKNTGIYAVSSMLSEVFFGCQRHKNIVNYRIFTRGPYQKKYEQLTKNRPKNAQQGPPKPIFKFYPLFSHPEPAKTWKPQHPEGFSERSAAPARPRVGKAMLRNHHHTARHRRNFKRLPGQEPNYVGPSCGYVGLCWPHVDPCWAKRSKKWEQQKNSVKRRIFWWSAAYLGAMLAHLGYVGLSWGQCGPFLGLRWPILGLCWPILELCWPILGLCWPILGLCWPSLGAMLPDLEAMLAHLEAYVGPCWPISRHKIPKMEKMGNSKIHCKTRGFLATRGGRWQGVQPLSPTERRERLRQGHGHRALAGFLSWRSSSAPPDHSALHFIAVWAWKLLNDEWGPASEIYSLGFLEHICWNRRFFGEQVSSRKLLRRVFPKEPLPISTCHFV